MIDNVVRRSINNIYERLKEQPIGVLWLILWILVILQVSELGLNAPDEYRICFAESLLASARHRRKSPKLLEFAFEGSFTIRMGLRKERMERRRTPGTQLALLVCAFLPIQLSHPSLRLSFAKGKCPIPGNQAGCCLFLPSP